MKGGIGLNLRFSGFERYIYLMFLSWEIDIKLCQNYTKNEHMSDFGLYLKILSIISIKNAK